MGQMLNISIDLEKIPKEKIITTDKEGNEFSKNQKFVKLTIFINDEKDNFGKDVKVTIEKPKGSTEKTIYIGDGRKYQTDDLG